FDCGAGQCGRRMEGNAGRPECPAHGRSARISGGASVAGPADSDRTDFSRNHRATRDGGAVRDRLDRRYRGMDPRAAARRFLNSATPASPAVWSAKAPGSGEKTAESITRNVPNVSCTTLPVSNCGPVTPMELGYHGLFALESEESVSQYAVPAWSTGCRVEI